MYICRYVSLHEPIEIITAYKHNSFLFTRGTVKVVIDICIYTMYTPQACYTYL